MSLPTFKKREDIPKGFEDEYEERDGEWVGIDRTSKLQKSLDAEREKREAAEKVAKKAAKEAADATARGAGATATELELAYKRIEDNIRTEYADKVAELDTLRAENQDLALTNVVKERFRGLGALKHRVDDFLTLHGKEFALSADKKPIVKAEPGKDIDKHIQSIMKQRPEWVQGTKATGGGAGGLTTTPAGSGPAGAVTFEDTVKNPAAAIAQANS